MSRRERGQVLPLLAVVILVAGLACLAAGRVGGAAVARAQAVTAADAAALAGAASGPRAAARLGGANGGRVTRFEQRGSEARVEVELGGAHAAARARRSGSGSQGGPAPALRAALARASQLLGGPVPTVAPGSAGRQPGDAAIRHQRGLAVDVPLPFVAPLAAVAAQAGLCQPYPESHPGHFQLCAPGRTAAPG